MGIMGIISTIVVGFIVGVLARFFYPGAVAMGFWMTTGLGIGGMIVGGFISGLIWKSPDGRFHPAGWGVFSHRRRGPADSALPQLHEVNWRRVHRGLQLVQFVERVRRTARRREGP